MRRQIEVYDNEKYLKQKEKQRDNFDTDFLLLELMLENYSDFLKQFNTSNKPNIKIRRAKKDLNHLEKWYRETGIVELNKSERFTYMQAEENFDLVISDKTDSESLNYSDVQIIKVGLEELYSKCKENRKKEFNVSINLLRNKRKESKC